MIIDKATCGRSLEGAVKIISALSLFFALCQIALEIYLIASYGLTVVEYDDPNKIELSGIANYLTNPMPSNKSEKGVDDVSVVNFLSSQPTGSMSQNPPSSSGDFQLFKFHPEGFKWVVGFWFTTWGMDIILSIALFVGAKERNEIICVMWFYIRCALLLSRVVCLIFYILAGITLLRKIPVILTFLFRAYCLMIVSMFIDELREEKLSKYFDESGINTNPRPSISSISRVGLVNQLESKVPIYFVSNNNMNYPFKFFS